MKKMDFNQFTQEIVNKIREYLPDSFRNADIQLQSVVKTNDVKLTGIVIREAESNICPTIYLEQFYQRFCEGTSDLQHTLSEIARIRLEHQVKGAFEFNLITDFEEAKDKIIPRIVNREWNKELLKVRPYKELADLAVTYHILVGDDQFGGTSSVPVTDPLMSTWGVDVDTVHTHAVSNMKRLIPSTFRKMSDVLRGMMPGMDEEMFFPTDEIMYVLSNSKGLGGAAAVLDEDMMSDITDKIGEKFFIIPSSTHEVIIVKSDQTDLEQITAMINEVNGSVVSEDERLSDHPYRYYKDKGIVIA